MIEIKKKAVIKKMREAGVRLATLVNCIMREVRPEVSTAFLDKKIEELLREQQLDSRTKGYRGYRHVSCISVNDQVVHGIPSPHKIIRPGDLVKVDVCASWRGYCADMARMMLVPGGDEQRMEIGAALLRTAQESLDIGIAHIKPGARIGDYSAAVQGCVERNGFSVIRDFAGHGIGRRMHEDPEILNYGKAGTGLVLRPGMSLAVEPMIAAGDYAIVIESDGWTARTADGSLAAHIEDTVVVTENGVDIMTRL